MFCKFLPTITKPTGVDRSLFQSHWPNMTSGGSESSSCSKFIPKYADKFWWDLLQNDSIEWIQGKFLNRKWIQGKKSMNGIERLHVISMGYLCIGNNKHWQNKQTNNTSIFFYFSLFSQQPNKEQKTNIKGYQRKQKQEQKACLILNYQLLVIGIGG